jgi:hypothetical protein
METINSQIFGNTNLLSEDDKELKWLKEMIDNYPVNAFGIINKKLNALGLTLTIGVIK